MVRYVALLRGINVGGHNTLSMADLRRLLDGLGFTQVTTYLQSGNALFTSASDDPERIARAIEHRILEDLGLKVTVLIRTEEDLATIVKGNPYPDAAQSPTLLHVGFLGRALEEDRLSGIDRQQFMPDEFQIADRAIYLWCPTGFHRTKLIGVLSERRLGTSMTARNWNTVTRLLSMMQG